MVIAIDCFLCAASKSVSVPIYSVQLKTGSDDGTTAGETKGRPRGDKGATRGRPGGDHGGDQRIQARHTRPRARWGATGPRRGRRGGRAEFRMGGLPQCDCMLTCLLCLSFFSCHPLCSSCIPSVCRSRHYSCFLLFYRSSRQSSVPFAGLSIVFAFIPASPHPPRSLGSGSFNPDAWRPQSEWTRFMMLNMSRHLVSSGGACVRHMDCAGLRRILPRSPHLLS